MWIELTFTDNTINETVPKPPKAEKRLFNMDKVEEIGSAGSNGKTVTALFLIGGKIKYVKESYADIKKQLKQE